jgi:hypothetical protein
VHSYHICFCWANWIVVFLYLVKLLLHLKCFITFIVVCRVFLNCTFKAQWLHLRQSQLQIRVAYWRKRIISSTTWWKQSLQIDLLCVLWQLLILINNIFSLDKLFLLTKFRPLWDASFSLKLALVANQFLLLLHHLSYRLKQIILQPINSLIYLSNLIIEPFVHMLQIIKEFTILIVVLSFSFNISSTFVNWRIEFRWTKVVWTVFI